MRRVAVFLRDKTPPRLLMIAALLLLTVSQFFPYFDDPTTGMLSLGIGLEAHGPDRLEMRGTGWELHPQAYLILALLALVLFREEIAEHPLFRRFGYWICLALVFAAVSPGAPIRAAGAAMGGIAFLMALIAAIWNQLLPRMMAEPLPREAPPER